MLTGLPDAGNGGAAAVLAPWAPILGFWVALFALAAIELAWPMRRHPDEDRGRLGTNLAMGLINAGLVGLVPVTTVAAALWAAGAGFGLLNLLPLPLTAAIVATVAVRSLATYALHRLSHAWSPLWRVHRVHHADRSIDLSTGFRNHPLELAYALGTYCGVAALAGLHAPTLAAYEVIAAVFGLWSHANIRLTPHADRVARTVLVTPAMHIVHHSADRAETDSNYGDVLSLWDRMFGTYRAPGEERMAAMRLGLSDAEDAGSARLLAQLRGPFESRPRS